MLAYGEHLHERLKLRQPDVVSVSRSFISNATPSLFMFYWPACSVHVAMRLVRLGSRDDPETLAHLVLPDPLANQAHLGHRALPETLETLEFQANPVCRHLPSLLQPRYLTGAQALMKPPTRQNPQKRMCYSRLQVDVGGRLQQQNADAATVQALHTGKIQS